VINNASAVSCKQQGDVYFRLRSQQGSSVSACVVVVLCNRQPSNACHAACIVAAECGTMCSFCRTHRCTLLVWLQQQSVACLIGWQQTGAVAAHALSLVAASCSCLGQRSRCHIFVLPAPAGGMYVILCLFLQALACPSNPRRSCKLSCKQASAAASARTATGSALSGWGAWGRVAARTLGPAGAALMSGTGTGWCPRGAALDMAAAGAQVRRLGLLQAVVSPAI
jgi:hypothetical protein